MAVQRSQVAGLQGAQHAAHFGSGGAGGGLRLGTSCCGRHRYSLGGSWRGRAGLWRRAAACGEQQHAAWAQYQKLQRAPAAQRDFPITPTAVARSHAGGDSPGTDHTSCTLMTMNIVDAQVHLNRLGSNWEHTDAAVAVDYAVATMDALGLSAVLIDEWAGFDNPTTKRGHLPGYFLPNGAVRGQHPFSEQAVALHPDRFGYIARIDPIDPDLEELMAGVRQSQAPSV